jgi:uncharacterized protein HemY
VTRYYPNATVAVLILLCLIAGMGTAQAKSGKGSSVYLTDTFRKWQAAHQKVCDLMGQFKFEEALKESKPLMGYLAELKLTDGKEMFETCNNLGAIHLHLKDFQEAHNLFWTAMKIGTQVYGSDSIQVGFVFKNLSMLYGERADLIFLKHRDELGGAQNQAPRKK